MKLIHIFVCLAYILISFAGAHIMSKYFIDTDMTTFLIMLYGNLTLFVLIELVISHYK